MTCYYSCLALNRRVAASSDMSHQGAAETIPTQQDARTGIVIDRHRFPQSVVECVVVRRRSGWGGNVHGLHDGDDSDDRNRSSNAFW